MRRRLTNLIICVLVFSCISTTLPVYAAATITIDEDEYNVYVDEYPDGIYNNIYAKFKSKKSNVDDYYLNLSSSEAEEIFAEALDNSNINMNNKLAVPMTAAFFRETDDDDKKVTDSLELLLPIPDDAQEHPEDTSFYILSGSKVKEMPFTLVECDEIYYAQFSLSSYTTYGFTYFDPDVYEEEEEEEEEEPEEEEPEEEEPEDTPTPVPEASPTPTPTKAPKSTPAPTPKPDNQSGSLTAAAKNASGTKDSVPKTGDDFPLTELIFGSILSGGILLFALYKRRR